MEVEFVVILHLNNSGSMKYFECYQKLKDIFNLSDDVIHIPASDMIIRNFDFISEGIKEELWPHEAIEKKDCS